MKKKATPSEFSSVIEEIRAQLAALSERIANLERDRQGSPAEGTDQTAALEKPAEAVQPPAAEEITEEELLAISAAVAAFLGVRAHIRQVRLIGSQAWAQEGRVSIQASHRLHY
ncbi:MAG TPA: hypothetical protein VG672_18245 [Bryobacteraceae bacterium]|jgi:methylmalonyl-CoA carboxyltransferase large subunit|nr:hypothetical protein [Bryobacteraceae bacterium]